MKPIKLIKHIVVLSLLLGATLAARAEVVIFVSTKGVDGAAGSRSAPMKSIAAGLAKAGPGDTVMLLEGSYAEAVAFPRSGAEGRPVTLKGEGRVVIDIAADKENRCGIAGRGVGFVAVEGIEVTGAGQGMKFKDCNHVVVRKCSVQHCDTGLSVEGAKAGQMLFEDVELADNVAGGVDVSDGVAMEDVTFRRCSAHENGCKGGTDGFGISHSCTTRNVRFENCTAYNNGSDGFDISGKKGFGVTLIGCISHNNGTKMWGTNFKCWNPGSTYINCVGYVTGKDCDGNFEALADNITYINCTSGENGDCGMKVGGKNIRIINCLFTGATKKAVWLKDPDATLTVVNCLATGCEPGDLGKEAAMAGNPLFVDPAKGDYRIRSGSAAAGKGKPKAEVTVDAAGRARPKDALAIGAYEPAS